MSDITRVALDAMGGDHAPAEMVKGAIEAVNKRDDIKILLTGQEALLKKALSEYTYPKDRIEIIPASEVIETAEPPVMAIRRKKDYFYRSSDESGEKGRSRCICICRKFRGDSCRRTGDRRKD